MNGFHCKEFERKPEGREDVDIESAQSNTENRGAAEESIFANKPGEVQTEQSRCQPVYQGELYLTLYDCQQYLELQHLEDD